jgi:hypothetical protein
MYYQRTADNRSRRFARCCNRVESGIIGRDSKEFYRCVLTTRLGNANDWPTMQYDLKKLKAQLSYKGVIIEYVFLPHVSDKNKLLHLDGIIRLRSGSLSLFELQVMWCDIHGATEVEFEPLRLATEQQLVHYIVNHMFKDYEKIVGFKGRMLISKGWMPKGWMVIDKLLTKRALDAVLRLGPVAWDIKRETFLGWLNGETVMFRYDGIWHQFKREAD